MEKKVTRINGNELLINSIVGKTIEDAKELAGFNGFAIRTVREDGEQFIVTMDHRMDRINIDVENGIVVAARIG